MRSAAALAWSTASLSLCGLAAGVLLIPQRLLQRPLAEGVIAVHLAPGGGLRLWQRPITATALSEFLALAARRQPPPRLRLVPDPQVPWGEVRQALATFERGVLPLELQLPTPQQQP